MFRFVRSPLHHNHYKGEFIFTYIKTLFSLTSTAKRKRNKQFDKLKINKKKQNCFRMRCTKCLHCGEKKTKQQKKWNVTILDCHFSFIVNYMEYILQIPITFLKL